MNWSWSRLSLEFDVGQDRTQKDLAVTGDCQEHIHDSRGSISGRQSVETWTGREVGSQA